MRRCRHVIGRGGFRVDDHGDRVGRCDSLLSEKRGERRGVFGLGGGVVPRGQELGLLGRGEQVDVADGAGRIGHDRGEHPRAAVGEAGDGAGVEQVCGVDERGRHAVAVAVAPVRSVRSSCRSNLASRHPAKSPATRRGRAGRDALGQCSGTTASPGTAGAAPSNAPGPASRRGARTARRHVRRRRGRLADLGEQLGEVRRRVHLGAQHQGVDEHADQHRRAPASPRPATGVPIAMSVVRRQPGQQHGERGVHDHEQRGVVLAGQCGQCRRWTAAVDLDAQCTARAGTRPPGAGRSVGSSSCSGRPARVCAPEGQLLRRSVNSGRSRRRAASRCHSV